ncbi:MAG: HD-GYP domain-containing protein [Vulcanimicrobiaceae bacterium]
MNYIDRAIHVATQERDEYTAQHDLNVGYLAEALGHAMQLPENELVPLREAGFVHDVGKIGIPDDILLKPHRLDAGEWEIIKTHSLRGERIVAAQSSVCWGRAKPAGDIVKAVRHHHEHYDGSGYPDGLRGDEIPLWARILLIADCYDALTEPRAYRLATSHEDTMAIMKAEAGVFSDPRLFEIFARMIETSPLKAEPMRTYR